MKYHQFHARSQAEWEAEHPELADFTSDMTKQELECLLEVTRAAQRETPGEPQ